MSGEPAAGPRWEVLVVGSGDAFGTGGRLQACLVLRSDAGMVLVDCGASSLPGLKRGGIDPGAIDAVIVTHLHGDHFGGLPFLVLDGQFAGRERPLVVAGPPGTRARLAIATEALFPGSGAAHRRFTLEVVELAPRVRTRVGPVAVTPVAVDHASGAPAYGLRIEAGDRLLAVSGDTAWTDSLIELADGADVLVCEAYSYAKRIPYHLDYATLAAHLGQLRCRQLVLTHLGPEMLAHVDQVAERCLHDGMVLEL
ncbi:MAG TPA: MBL fold metallo-hydrolase [Candidatus Micrarchaeia archaeon]|nr:MBL fold metallo-hydrolase [Candidatus Micrarchaeia archaeon]